MSNLVKCGWAAKYEATILSETTAYLGIKSITLFWQFTAKKKLYGDGGTIGGWWWWWW